MIFLFGVLALVGWMVAAIVLLIDWRLHMDRLQRLDRRPGYVEFGNRPAGQARSRHVRRSVRRLQGVPSGPGEPPSLDSVEGWPEASGAPGVRPGDGDAARARGAS